MTDHNRLRELAPTMRARLAEALHEAANLPDYNLSHRMQTVHGGPQDMSYVDAADMILGTMAWDGFVIEQQALLDENDRLREALKLAAETYHSETHPSLGPADECAAWPCNPAARAALESSGATPPAQPLPADPESLQMQVLRLGGTLEGFEHAAPPHLRSSKPSDPDDVRWECLCGIGGSPERVQRHWLAELRESITHLGLSRLSEARDE